MESRLPDSPFFKTHYPFLIAGPCSAESEQQLLTTAQQMRDSGINPNLFRAGIWKPRTRPGSFEGVGEAGLKWLQTVKQQFGWSTTVEVAHAAHIDAALKHNVDVLWIGARTAVNPFLVTELATALHGIDIPVMVKNPVSPDLELWIGALERMANAGVTNIAAIHRGFTSFDKTIYRNKPTWDIPLELMRRYPSLTLIIDPSHISGKRDLLLQVAQRGLDLNYRGIMIETHCDPDNALTDAQQQVTPFALKGLLDSLLLRREDSDDPIYHNTIEQLRAEIDKLDEELLEVLATRMAYSEKLGIIKRDNNIAIFQPQRWNEILNSRSASAINKQLSSDIVIRLFELIHEESIRHQTRVYNKVLLKDRLI